MGKQWKQWRTLFSWVPKTLQMVTVAMKLKDTCSLEEKLWNLDSVLKSRDITLLTNVHMVKAVVFPVVMYGHDSWTIKKAECQRTDAFELWCWRLLRVPWTARRSNQSVLKEISPEYSLEGWCWSWSSNTLATICKNWLIGRDLGAGKDWRQEEKGTTEDEMVGWHHRFDGHEFEQTLGVEVTKRWTRLSDWMELNWSGLQGDQTSQS